MRDLSLVCWNCNKKFWATEKFYDRVIKEQIPDNKIICDCGPGFSDVEHAIELFWAEVWS